MIVDAFEYKRKDRIFVESRPIFTVIAQELCVTPPSVMASIWYIRRCDVADGLYFLVVHFI